jgi:hypothetical protein
MYKRIAPVKGLPKATDYVGGLLLPDPYKNLVRIQQRSMELPLSL